MRWLFAMLLLAACRSADPVDTVFAGKTLYEHGRLHLDVEAYPDSSGVVLWMGLSPATLGFEEREGAYVSRFSLDLELRSEATKTLVASAHVADTLRMDSFEATRAYRTHLVRQHLAAPPGTYVAEVVARDQTEGSTAQQRVRVLIPTSGTPSLSPVRLDARLPGDTLRPLVSLYLPARLDTLRASLVCRAVPSHTEAAITMRVLAFETDTLAALPPYGFSSMGSLAYRGVRTERADTIQVSRQGLRGAAQQVTVEFGLPRLAPGVYRLDFVPESLDTSPPLARLLIVQPPDFPRILTLGEMVEALGYLLTRREARQLREAQSAEARRDLFDRFWGRRAPNREAAGALMQRYYARVEEANTRFSAFKPGWKTDRGMVYVVLGPPLHTETWPDREVWHYSYDEADPARTFVFNRVYVAAAAEVPFAHYVLERSGAHQQLWQRAVERWRSGEAW